MSVRKDLTGIIYHAWMVESYAYNVKTHAYWNVICKCGSEHVLDGCTIRNNTAAKKCEQCKRYGN